MDAKDMILADAIETAIRSERTIVKLKRIIAGSACLNVMLIVYLIIA